ncbi:MAG: DUF362 domain-containing protein [Deltaproteobacteria bacterium]|nr:DUF362 domain-containing protein [Deltaproteobacteria bacterium]
MSKVYLTPARHDESAAGLAHKVELLWRVAGFDDLLERERTAAIKLHVGEPGTVTFAPPSIAAAVVKLCKDAGAVPFITDTCVVYKSARSDAVGHARVAEDHGFGIGEVGAPFVAADGLTGTDDVELPFDGRHHKTLGIASAIAHARSMIVISHVTGHLGTGLAAVLKNLGMGCASKKAKLRQHHGQQPWISAATCTACGECAKWCPSEAIEVDDAAEIDKARCIGCGECVAVCPEGAVRFDWGIMGRELQERICEHAAGVVRGKPGRIGYLTAAFAITKDCDCMGMAQPSLVDDIGLLASTDPVAIDRAALDLVRDRDARGLEALSYPEQDGTIQLRYAEELGLGSNAYELVMIDAQKGDR